MEWKEISLSGEPFLVTQVQKHYSLHNYAVDSRVVLKPTDWILLDRFYNVTGMDDKAFKELLKHWGKKEDLA